MQRRAATPVSAPAASTMQVKRAGEIAADVTITAKDATALFQRALATAAGTAGDSKAGDVVWVDGDNELLVRPAKSRVILRPGFVLAGIAVFSEQTGDTEVVVSFATGAPKEPLGLIVATETRPRGLAAIVDQWSDPLIAAAWAAILRIATDAAASAGADEQHQPLVPIALAADTSGLTVTPQAPYTFGREQR
jgi:hypothetical protein